MMTETFSKTLAIFFFSDLYQKTLFSVGVDICVLNKRTSEKPRMFFICMLGEVHSGTREGPFVPEGTAQEL